MAVVNVQDRVKAAAAAVAVATAAAMAACGPAEDDGWQVTVYYTAVAAYHDGPPQRVTGCPRLDCGPADPDAKADLGEYPDFVEHVRQHLEPREGDEGGFALGLDLILDGLERLRDAA